MLSLGSTPLANAFLRSPAEFAAERLGQGDGEIPNQYLDCSKARRELGWSPRFGFEGALEETIDWYRARLGLRGQTV